MIIDSINKFSQSKKQMGRLLLTLTLAMLIFSVNATSCDEKHDKDVEKFDCSLAFAQKGKHDAQFEVAYKYYYGIGVALDLVQAFSWYEKSATQGNRFAQNILGSMFYKGNGVPKDYKQAIHWYIKAAEQGHPYAPFHIGKMYYLGEGVPQEFLRSLMWCYIAEKKGIKKAGKFRFELEKKMVFDQIKKARELSKAWLIEYSKK